MIVFKNMKRALFPKSKIKQNFSEVPEIYKTDFSAKKNPNSQ